LDVNSVFQEINNIQGELSSSFGKYMQKSDELVKELKKKIEQAKSLTSYLIRLEEKFQKEYLNKESYKKAFEKYFSGNYSKRLLVPIANYSDLYVQFTDALLEDDKRLRQLKKKNDFVF
jgi:hypothetical protein